MKQLQKKIKDEGGAKLKREKTKLDKIALDLEKQQSLVDKLQVRVNEGRKQV